MIPRILLTGGGTAGSVTPLIALAEHIRASYPTANFLFVGSQRGPERILAEAAGLPFQSISSGKWRRYWSVRNLTDLGRIWRGYRAAGKIIASWHPTIIISAGSFVSVPIVWAGHRAGIRIIIHQQDIRPGLANRLMTAAADLITVSFEQSLKNFPKHKVQLIGNPVRPEILRGSAIKAQEIFHLEPATPTLLVMGGGTGSNFLNQLIGSLAFQLVKQWQVIHLTGSERNYPELHDERYHRYDLLTWQIPHALAAATVVLSRCGLGAMTELAALSKAAIFVPMPDSHQDENAQIIRDLQGGIVYEQDQLSSAKFFASIESLRKNPAERTRLGTNLRQLYRADALERLAAIVISLQP